MFCPSCGTQLPDDSQFCSNCGARISASTALQLAQSPVQQLDAQTLQHSVQQPQQAAPKKKKSMIKIVVIAAAVLVVLGIAAAGFGSRLYHHGLKEITDQNEGGERIEPQKLYGDENFALYVTGLKRYDWGSLTIYLQLDNYSKKKINARYRLEAVNGIGFRDTHTYRDIPAKSSQECYIHLDNTDLEALGVDEIGTLELVLAYDIKGMFDAGETVNAGTVIIRSERADSMSYAAPEGELVLEQMGMRIYYLGCYPGKLDDSGYSDGPNFNFLFENTSDWALKVITGSLTINGVSTDTAFEAGGTIQPGKQLVDKIVTREEALNKAGVREMDEIQLHVTVADADDTYFQNGKSWNITIRDIYR